jgi:hypothetical protein
MVVPVGAGTIVTGGNVPAGAVVVGVVPGAFVVGDAGLRVPFDGPLVGDTDNVGAFVMFGDKVTGMDMLEKLGPFVTDAFVGLAVMSGIMDGGFSKLGLAVYNVDGTGVFGLNKVGLAVYNGEGADVSGFSKLGNAVYMEEGEIVSGFNKFGLVVYGYVGPGVGYRSNTFPFPLLLFGPPLLLPFIPLLPFANEEPPYTSPTSWLPPEYPNGIVLGVSFLISELLFCFFGGFSSAVRPKYSRSTYASSFSIHSYACLSFFLFISRRVVSLLAVTSKSGSHMDVAKRNPQFLCLIVRDINIVKELKLALLNSTNSFERKPKQFGLRFVEKFTLGWSSML